MRIMLDTNVLVSAFIFNSNTINRVMENVICENKLILSSFIIDDMN